MDNLDKILDECIDRLGRGESPEACLADYPEHRERLAPLLAAALETKRAFAYTPSAGASDRQKQRFNTALAASREKRANRMPLLGRFPAWTKASVTVAAVIIVALLGYFAFRPAETPPAIVAQPDPTGNFAFMVSDEVNAIGDFQELNVTIARVTLNLSGDGEQSVQFEPSTATVDLTGLQGTLAREIWRGSVPDGEYSGVFIEVSRVSGILLSSGEEIEIKLPSGKLHISKPFQVGSGELTSFVYDLTVVKAGQSGQYILKPQVDQSGADQDFIEVEPEEIPQNNKDKTKENNGKNKSSGEE